MSDIAISVENISKCYRIGTQGGPAYHRLSEMITGVPRALWNAGKSLVRQRSAATKNQPDGQRNGEFWALKNVSFQIKQGEVVGIIGRNGAGKSTLLKILSRITEPTSGRFGVRGRVASLLEVGTGFHPELTGRENIYVSGVTLGMTRAEIKRRFDEIVDFSGVAKFLDTPVKHYSSGMQVRLGFAVAAHLESEILIVDEVLAVGDGDFQKKCLGKMRSLKTQGRTVLMVSHQIQVVTSLCGTAMVLVNGALEFQGASTQAADYYFGVALDKRSYVFDTRALMKRVGDDIGELHRACITNDQGKPSGAFDLSESITIEMEYSVHRNLEKVAVPNFHVFDERGEYVFCTSASSMHLGSLRQQCGRYLAKCLIPSNLLNSGTFTVGVALTSLSPALVVSFFERDALQFHVTENFETTLKTTRHGYAGTVPGPIRPNLDWRIDAIEAAIET